jgi:hypothetical protein
MVLNSFESELLWLNVTNIALGSVVLLCMIVIGGAVLVELRARKRRKAVLSAEPHALFTPELGLTMADGGEPVTPAKPRRKKSATPKR